MKHDDVFLKHILDETSFLLKEISPLSNRQLVNNEVSKRALFVDDVEASQ